MRADDWGQDGVDTDVPNIARMYDYYLGGLHNFPADREVAQRVIGAYPTLPAILRLNRIFLRRAVTYLANAGIRQFIDLGSGLPTIGNVHEIAQAVQPEARVVYVDIDTTAVLHSRLMLVGNPYATVLQVDLRQPELVLNHRDLRWQIDLDLPVAILATAVLHFVTDADDPHSLMKTYGSVLAPGSYIAISHAAQEIEPERSEKVIRLYARSGIPMQLRTHAEISCLFGGFDLVEPGLCLLDDWHPELHETTEPRLEIGYCGVARKR